MNVSFDNPWSLGHCNIMAITIHLLARTEGSRSAQENISVEENAIDTRFPRLNKHYFASWKVIGGPVKSRLRSAELGLLRTERGPNHEAFQDSCNLADLAPRGHESCRKSDQTSQQVRAPRSTLTRPALSVDRYSDSYRHA